MTGTGSYDSNPFFRPDTPPVSSLVFRQFVLSPAFKRFWTAKERAWRKAGIIITRYEFVDLLVAQEGRCGICRLDQTVFGRMLAVDHLHATGAILGLACYRCNFARGVKESKISCGARVRWTVPEFDYLRRTTAGVELLSLRPFR